MLNNYICALDIGSSKLCASLFQFKGKRCRAAFFESIPLKGVSEGVVVDATELVNTVTKLIKNLKSRSRINVKNIYANISGQDILTKHSRSIMPLAERGNKVIARSDIHKVIEQAHILGSSLDEEIIHQIPLSFNIDSKSGVTSPLGLYSHRLEVDLFLICAKLSAFQSLCRAIGQSGCELRGVFFSGLASSRAAMDDNFKEGLNLFCDAGADMTELLLFKNGVLSGVNILQMGGNDFTARLAEELKIPFELAEDIKKTYGLVGDSAQLTDDKEILIKKSDLYKPIKQKLVAGIVTQQAKEFCAKLKEQIAKVAASYEVNNLIIAGRSVLLEGFIETLENELNIRVKLARLSNKNIPLLAKEDNALSGQRYLAYLTSIGVICEVMDGDSGLIEAKANPSGNIFVSTFNKIKEVYQEYF
ncbi:MAG: cell division protein FtsA [Candidatus Omnitrophota bacterium]